MQVVALYSWSNLLLGAPPTVHCTVSALYCRLDASYEAAVKYVGQFPSPLVTLVRTVRPKFVCCICD